MRTIRIKGIKNIGFSTTVDDDVYEVVRHKNLKYKNSDKEESYVYWEETKGNSRHRIKLHRWVLRVTDSNIHVDHVDKNPLNNQKENLRESTRSENNRNRSSFKNSSSTLKGVSKTKSNKWRAQIGYEKKVYLLGTFESEEEAGRNYDWWAIKLFKAFANLNYPEYDYSSFTPLKEDLGIKT